MQVKVIVKERELIKENPLSKIKSLLLSKKSEEVIVKVKVK